MVLGIFTLCMAAIVLEAHLHMDKFKPALLMLLAWLAIGLHYYFSGDDPARFEPFLKAQEHNEIEVFGLIGFMAFMWMIVEILAEDCDFVVFLRFDEWLEACGIVTGKIIMQADH